MGRLRRGTARSAAGAIQTWRDGLASSGSYARGDQPRSVPDPDAALHDEAGRQQRAYNDRQAAEQEARREKLLGDRLFTLAASPQVEPVSPPGPLEALIPFWGSGREAKADSDKGDVLGALFNSALVELDLVPGASFGKAMVKGAIKKSGPFVWRTKPWEEAKGVRQWLSDVGHVEPGQPAHHWAIPQNGWGKAVPDWLKNQPWNIKELDAVTHGRVHGRYTVDGVKLPQFNALGRYWYGTPDWFKATNVTLPSGVWRAASNHSDQ